MVNYRSLLFGIFMCAWNLSALAQAAQFIPLDSAPNVFYASGATAISADGSTVVGAGSRVLPADASRDAFRWTQSTGIVNLQTLPTFELSNTVPVAVSGDGSALVGNKIEHDDSDPNVERMVPFRWIATEGMVELDDTSGQMLSWGIAGDISADGRTIVGAMADGDGKSEAFMWRAETGAVGLGDLPGGDLSSRAVGISSDGTVVAGNGESAAGSEAFRWSTSTGMTPLGPLPGGHAGSAVAISSDGSTIVGWGYTESSGLGGEAFRWTEQGGMQLLGDLPGGYFSSFPYAVSGDGSIVLGISWSLLIDATDGYRAFVWDETHGMRDLQEVLMKEHGLAAVLAGWQDFTASGISDDGISIVGGGRNPDGNTEAWLVHLDRPLTAPEPGTLLLCGLASTAILSGRRRTR